MFIIMSFSTSLSGTFLWWKVWVTFCLYIPLLIESTPKMNLNSILNHFDRSGDDINIISSFLFLIYKSTVSWNYQTTQQSMSINIYSSPKLAFCSLLSVCVRSWCRQTYILGHCLLNIVKINDPPTLIADRILAKVVSNHSSVLGAFVLKSKLWPDTTLLLSLM